MKPTEATTESTPVSRLLTVIMLIIVTTVLFFAKDFLIPIALSVLIAFLLSPIVLWLERRGIKRVVASVAIVVVLMCFVGGLGYMLTGQFVEFVDKLPQYRSNIVAKIHAIKPGKQSVFKRAEAMFTDLSEEMERETTGPVVADGAGSATQTGEAPLNEDAVEPAETVPVLPTEDDKTLKMIANAQTGKAVETQDSVPVRVVEGPANSWQSFQNYVGPVLTILGNAGLVMLLVIFFLLQREDLRDRVIRLAGYNKVRVTTEALEEAAGRVSKYLLMQLIVNVTYGIPVAIGLFLIGVPNALLWGAMATILRFIPYIGPWIAAAMPLALSLAVFDNWTMPLLTLGLFIGLELLSNNVMEPILYGQSTGVSPIAIIISAVFWTWLWGAVGLVLATPLTVCLVVLGRHIPQLTFLHILLGDEPVLTEDARVYNRLLSGFVDDAVEIAEDYVDRNSVPELYDEVILPALASAETDRSEDMLSAKRYEKFIHGMRDLLEEVSEKLETDAAEETPAHAAAENGGASVEAEALRPARRVLCIPVNDPTDECAALMLKQLLEQRHDDVEVAKTGMLASEIVDYIRAKKFQVLVLSSVPPYAVTHTRYLTKRIAAEFPDIKLYAGLWKASETAERADEKLKEAGISKIYTSLSDAGLRI